MTDSTKDPRELIAEGRKHDEAMTPGPYRYDRQGYVESMDRSIDHTGSETEVLGLGARNEPADGEGAAWMRTNLRVLLDGYTASLDENVRLGGCLQSRAEHARLRDGADVRFRADVLRLTETARAASENWMDACRQRDEAVAERDAAIAGAYRAGVRSGQEDLPRAIQVERMRPVVEAADAWRDGAARVDQTSLDSDLENAIDAYRASKETK